MEVILQTPKPPGVIKQVGGSRGMKDSERSYTVASSSFGFSGGRYIGAKIERAAIKAARVQFRKAASEGGANSGSNSVDLTLSEITKSRGGRKDSASYTVTRVAKPPTSIGGFATGIVSRWNYSIQRIPSSRQ